MNLTDLKKLSGLREANRLQDDYYFREKLTKIQGLPREHGLKIIWGWIKQDHITFQEFQELIYRCYGNGLHLDN